MAQVLDHTAVQALKVVPVLMEGLALKEVLDLMEAQDLKADPDHMRVVQVPMEILALEVGLVLPVAMEAQDPNTPLQQFTPLRFPQSLAATRLSRTARLALPFSPPSQFQFQLLFAL
jgi:hypothetical protein